MASINGKDVVVQLSTDGTTYKSLVCEISNSLPISRETNSVTTKCDNGTTTRSLGAYSWEVSGEAVAETAPSGTQISYEEMLGYIVGGNLLYVKVENPAASGSNFYHQGQAYLTSLELSNEVNGVSQFSFTLSGTGALDISA